MRSLPALVLLFVALLPAVAFAEPIAARPSPAARQPLVGVNVENPQWLSPTAQDETIARLKAAGVQLVLIPLAAPYEAAHAFLIKADRAGIRTALIVPLWDMSLYPEGTLLRRSAGLPGMFDMPPLSAADPARFATFLAPHLARIEAAGVQLAALELGNEINWAAFNGDFPLPATGRVLGDADLVSDPAGQQIAAGLNAYIRLAATLKAMRDKTQRNARTPIISAGLADFGPPGPLSAYQAQAVAVDATLRYLRAHGLDAEIDAYGVHTYPDPTRSAEARRQQWRTVTFAECRSEASGRPCWLTEWGLPADTTTCPPADSHRAVTVRETLADLAPFVRTGAVQALIYYAWDNPTDRLSLYRCNALTEGGRAVLAPAP